MADWFKKGLKGYQETQDKRQKEREENSAFSVHKDLWYWYISKQDAQEGNEKKLIFLTEFTDVISTDVHEFPKVPNNWREGVWRLTCPKKTGMDTRCPACEMKDNYSRLRAHFAVLDVTGYKDRDDIQQCPIKVLSVGGKVVEILNEYAEANGGLRGWAFKVKRLKNKGSSQGDLWNPVQHFDLEEFAAKYNSRILKSAQRFPAEWGFIKNPSDPPESQLVTLPNLPFEQILAPMTAQQMADLTGLRFAAGYDSVPSASSSAPSPDNMLDNAEFPDAPF